MSRSLRRKLRQADRAKILSAEERVRQILDERTEHLANRRVLAASATIAPRVLVCDAGRERFGIPVEGVAEIMPFRGCTPLPDGPAALVGLFGRGGRIVSVIDLALLLGLDPGRPEDNSHLVLLRREQPQVALRVARAHAVVAIKPLTGNGAAAFRSEAVVGLAEAESGLAEQDKVLSLLDLDRLLHPFLPSPGSLGV